MRLPRRDAWLLLACALIIALFGRHSPRSLAPDQAPIWFSQPIPYTHRYYFGGHPVRGGGSSLNLGPTSATFSGATQPRLAPACLAAPTPAPTAASASQTIAGNLPGLYGAPWVANFNGDLIAALHVTVPRNPARPPAAPTLQIYRPGAATAAFSQPIPVTVTRGSEDLLYRMFIFGPIRCIDLIIPNGTGAGTAYLYYPFRGRLFEAEGTFSVER